MIVVLLRTYTYQDTIDKLSSLHFLTDSFEWKNPQNKVILPTNNNDPLLRQFVRALNNSVGREVITTLEEDSKSIRISNLSANYLSLYSFGLRQVYTPVYRSYTAVGRWLVIRDSTLQSNTDVVNYIISLLTDENIEKFSGSSDTFWQEVLRLITPDLPTDTFSQKLIDKLKIIIVEGTALAYIPRVQIFISKSRLSTPYTTVVLSESFDKIDLNSPIIYLKE